jgi:protein phosphatase
MSARYSARTDRGRKRPANEDAFAVCAERDVYAVADGLGGHVAGRTAAELGAAELLRCLEPGSADNNGEEADSDAGARLRAAIRAANRCIRQRAERDAALRGMGTTLAALQVEGGRAWFAHVGDSRIYLLRDAKLRLLTVDHSVVGDLVSRRALSREQARSHPNRHVITRALGVRAEVEPDVAELGIRAGDLFLLCTDGLTGALEDVVVERLLLECGEDLERATAALVDAANREGGDDNITVVVVRPEAGQSARVPRRRISAASESGSTR